MLIKILSTPGEMQRQLAEEFKRSRLEKRHSREKAKKLTGVPAPTIRKFEEDGQISFRQFLMLCHSYGDMVAMKNLFPEPEPTSIDELLKSSPVPKRGRT